MHKEQTITLPAQVVELVAAHLAHLERQLALEIAYPDDVDDADESRIICARFDKLEQDMTHTAMDAMDKLMQVLMPERYTLLVEAQMHESDKRANEAQFLAAQAEGFARTFALDEIV